MLLSMNADCRLLILKFPMALGLWPATPIGTTHFVFPVLHRIPYSALWRGQIVSSLSLWSTLKTPGKILSITYDNARVMQAGPGV